MQNGAYYYAPSTDFAFGNTTWDTVSRSGLRAADFKRTYITLLPGPVDATEHPDFSDTGAPITFGFYTGNSTGFHIESDHGYDNFYVAATYPGPTSVPEPSSALLTGAGAGAALWFGRRSRYHRLKCNADPSSPQPPVQ